MLTMPIDRASIALKRGSWSKGARGALLLSALIAMSVIVNGTIILLSPSSH